MADTITLQDNLFLGTGIDLRVGTLNTNGKNVTPGTIRNDLGTPGGAKGLTLGASAISCGSVTLTDTPFTFNAGTSSITSSGSINAPGLTFYDLSSTGDVFGAAFHNLTMTGSALTVKSPQLDENITVSGLLTIGGANAGTSRMNLRSSVSGTPRTITAASVSASNVNFEDIVGAGAANWNLAAITGGAGDCGGNSGITFTTGAFQYWVADTGSYSNGAKWMTSSGGATPGRVPLPQDTAIFDALSFTAGSKTITFDMNVIGPVDFSAATNSPTLSKTAQSRFYGNISLATGGMTVSGTGAYTYLGHGTSNFTSNGRSWTGALSMPTHAQGHLIFADNFTGGTGSTLALTSGIMEANANVTTASFTSGGTETRELYLGPGAWSLSLAGVFWNVSGSGLTLHAETSNLAGTATSATACTFNGNGLTYYDLTLPGAASIGATTLSGSNSFHSILPVPLSSIKFTAGTTQTVIVPPAWAGTVGNLITIQTDSGGVAATISCASGTASCDYLSLKDNTATGGASFYAGTHSTNVSGNTGWTFTAPPVNATFSASASLVVAGTAIKRTTGTLSASASLAAQGKASTRGTGTLSASASLAAVGKAAAHSTMTSNASSSLAAVGKALVRSTAIFNAGITSYFQGPTIANFSASASLVAVGKSKFNSAAIMSPSAAVAFAGHALVRSTATLSPHSGLTGVGAANTQGIAALNSSAALSAVGKAATRGNCVMAASAVAAFAGKSSFRGTASFVSSAALDAHGSEVVHAVATMASGAGLSAYGIATRIGTADFHSGTVMSAHGTRKTAIPPSRTFSGSDVRIGGNAGDAATLQKTPGDDFDIAINWADPPTDLGPDLIVTSTWEVKGPDDELLVSDGAINSAGQVTSVWLEGGTSGGFYTLTNTIGTAGDRTFGGSLIVQMDAYIFLPQSPFVEA